MQIVSIEMSKPDNGKLRKYFKISSAVISRSMLCDKQETNTYKKINLNVQNNKSVLSVYIFRKIHHNTCFVFQFITWCVCEFVRAQIFSTCMHGNSRKVLAWAVLRVFILDVKFTKPCSHEQSFAT